MRRLSTTLAALCARRLTRAVALAERQRIARDLHDGIAQDLALIAAFRTELAEAMGPEHPVTVAARRALSVTRSMIDELSELDGTPPRDAFDALAQELECRFPVSIGVRAEADVELSASAVGDLVRIAREAIANAARHGSAEHVTISLERVGAGAVLRVRDDGRGGYGAHGERPADGFGLRSMRERAASLGAYLTVGPVHSGGTELVVELP